MIYIKIDCNKMKMIIENKNGLKIMNNNNNYYKIKIIMDKRIKIA